MSSKKAQPKPERPRKGGSYIRDPKTGTLTRRPAEDTPSAAGQEQEG